MKCLQYYEKSALITKQQAISYAQLFAHVQAYAPLFQDVSCQKAAIYSENRPEWIYALYAAWRNHSAAVPIDFMSTLEETAYILEDCKPEVVFCSREREQDLRAAAASLSYALKVIVFEDINTIMPDAKRDFAPLERADADTALIIYTSGTTGSPKGAMLSFGNLMANADGVSRDSKIYSAEQRALVFLPLHHVYPLLGSIIIPLYVGATCVFSPSMAADDIRETLQTHGVTLITGVPRFYNLLRKGIREKIQASAVARLLFRFAEFANSPALSRRLFNAVHQKFGGKIRFLISGGAAIEDEVARDFHTLGFDVLIGYGMTEAAPMIAFTRPGTLRIGSSGHPLPCNDVKIVDGEILAKGRNIMQGYYNRPEETAAVMQDGWLHTGDLGHIDADGYLFVTGRKKDIIVLPSGKNINPEEIEASILKESPLVKEIGVFMHENVLQAVIYPDLQQLQQRGTQAFYDDMRWLVIDAYNQRVSPPKRISKFTLTANELPKTRLGKIKRFQLPELTKSAAPANAPQAEPDLPEYKMIAAFLKNQTGKAVAPGDLLEMDLGLDSLDKISLLTFLESTFGVQIQDEEGFRHLSVEQIAAHIAEKKVKMVDDGINWHQLLHENAQVTLPTSSLFHVVGSRILNVLVRGYFSLRGRGLDHLARLPKTPVIFVVNHQSYLDAVVVSNFFKVELLQRTYFYAKEEHFRKWWQQWFAAKDNVIIIDMGRQLKHSLQTMAAALRSGKNLVIFPEGSRSRDGQMTEFKKAFAILSRELNVPIMPVALKGAYEAMPVGKTLPKFRQEISVEFLPPVHPGSLSYEELTEKVRQQISDVLGE